MAKQRLKPLAPLRKDVDLGTMGNFGSTYHTQSTEALHRKLNVERFQDPDRGYIIADGCSFVETIEAIEFAIRSKDYAKGNPAAREKLKKTRDKYLHVLVYNKELFDKEGLLRLHECMLSPINYSQRQKRKADDGLSDYLELYEHQKGIRVILNLGSRRAASSSGELDTGSSTPSE